MTYQNDGLLRCNCKAHLFQHRLFLIRKGNIFKFDLTLLFNRIQRSFIDNFGELLQCILNAIGCGKNDSKLLCHCRQFHDRAKNNGGQHHRYRIHGHRQRSGADEQGTDCHY